MKRKLPSQSNKPETEEQLATEATEAPKTDTTPKMPDASPTSDVSTAPITPPDHLKDDLEVEEVPSASIAADDFSEAPSAPPKQEDASADFSENDIKFDLSGTPFSMPEDIPDPFVSGNFDENEMVMEAPAKRPGAEPAPTPAEPEMPPKKNFSTEALVDTPPNTPPGDPSPAAKANPSSADVLAEDGIMDAPVSKPAAASEATDNWDLGDLVDIPSGPSASSVLEEEDDRSPFDSGPKVDSPKTPPWKSGKKSSGERTMLPGQQVPSNSGNDVSGGAGGSKVGGMISIAVLLGLVVGTAIFYQNRESVIEALSRWTGTLNNVSQEVPPVAEVTPTPMLDAPQLDTIPPEAVVRADELAPVETAEAEPAPVESTTKVEVLDVDPDEAEKPIVADERTELPEDVDRFAALQEAIERKRAERRQKTSAKLEDEAKDLDPKDLPPELVTKRNMDIIKETNNALKDYKKALAGVGNPALKPRPGDFFEGRQRGENGDVLDPPSNEDTGTRQVAEKQPPLETYGNPIIEDPAELVTPKQQDDGIRKLEDFNLSMFEPSDERIRIPQYVAPSLSASTFPPLEVLSFVPDYGIVGLNRGQEGVLLIGESLEGWELISVFDAYAEFRKGEFKKIVTIKDANR